MTTHSLSTAKTVHHSILYFQRKMRTVRQQLPPISVSTDVSLILMLLSSDDELIPSELAHFTGLTPSQISRRLAKLETANFINRTRGTDDLRTVAVHFTPEGRIALDEVRQQNNLVTDLGSRPLTSQETGYLEDFFRNLMDQFGTPSFKTDPRARPLSPQQRRIARGMKMVGPNYFDTGIELNVYHVLLELDKVERIRFKDLNEMLPISSSGLSRILGALHADKLVTRKVQKDNVKNIYFAFTKKGKDYFRILDNTAARKMLGAINAIDKATIDRALAILEKCYSRPVSITTETSHQVVRCATKKQFFQARAFFLERLVETRRHTSLLSSIIPDHEICFMAVKNNQVVGLLHARDSKGRHLEMVALELVKDEAQVRALLLHALEKAFPNHTVGKVRQTASH
jgi:DNA-binding MarR family transcriptional regulator